MAEDRIASFVSEMRDAIAHQDGRPSITCGTHVADHIAAAYGALLKLKNEDKLKALSLLVEEVARYDARKEASA